MINCNCVHLPTSLRVAGLFVLSLVPPQVRLTKNGKAEDRHFEDLEEYDEALAFEFEI